VWSSKASFKYLLEIELKLQCPSNAVGTWNIKPWLSYLSCTMHSFILFGVKGSTIEKDKRGFLKKIREINLHEIHLMCLNVQAQQMIKQEK